MISGKSFLLMTIWPPLVKEVHEMESTTTHAMQPMLVFFFSLSHSPLKTKQNKILNQQTRLLSNEKYLSVPIKLN